MSNNTQKHIKDQLGVGIATAHRRLVKSILFDLVKRLELHYCYVCKYPIIHINDLSIEHKLPWLHIDPKLYWDLSNIAFSHLRCNTQHRKTPKRYPEGFKKCVSCKNIIEISALHIK